MTTQKSSNKAFAHSFKSALRQGGALSAAFGALLFLFWPAFILSWLLDYIFTGSFGSISGKNDYYLMPVIDSGGEDIAAILITQLVVLASFAIGIYLFKYRLKKKQCQCVLFTGHKG